MRNQPMQPPRPMTSRPTWPTPTTPQAPSTPIPLPTKPSPTPLLTPRATQQQRPPPHQRLPPRRTGPPPKPPHNQKGVEKRVKTPLPLLTNRFVTNWISRQRTSKPAKTCCVTPIFRIGGTTPPIPISTPMRCKRRIRWAPRYGSSTARPRRNCPTSSAWRI